MLNRISTVPTGATHILEADNKFFDEETKGRVVEDLAQDQMNPDPIVNLENLTEEPLIAPIIAAESLI